MTTLRNGVSAQVYSAKASTVYGSPVRSLVRAGTGTTAYMLVQFGLPKDLHKGATVASATLRLYASAAWSGTTVLTATRLAAKFPASTTTYNNRPGTTGTSVTNTQTGTAANAEWSFDVTAHVQAMVDGAANYGWRVATDSTAARYLFGFKASAYKPVLDVTYAYAPPKPTDLNPSGGAVSVDKPTLQYQSSDATVKHRIEVDPAANGTTPAFDTGMIDTDDEQLDLASTAYAGLALAASTQWRVMVQNASGQQSAWSDWVPFTRTAKPALTIAQPTANVYEATPPFDADMTGIKRMQVVVKLAGAVVFDSGEFATTDGTYTPPVDVFTSLGGTYNVEVRARDGVAREDTPGDPSYMVATLNTTRSRDNTIGAVTGLAVTQAKPTPWLDVSWSRAAAPDGWAVIRNGVEVFRTDDYTDLATGGTGYAWRDYTAPPNRTHVYTIGPIVNAKIGGTSPSVTITPTGAGVWLVDPDTGVDVVLWGDDAGDFGYGEDATTYNPIGADAPVQVTSALRGIEGGWTGIAVENGSAPAYTVDLVESRLFTFKGDPANVLRLVAGDLNIPVNVFALSVAPDPSTRAGDRLLNVSFSFAQVGELPFAAVL